jgi:hypothetical protein
LRNGRDASLRSRLELRQGLRRWGCNIGSRLEARLWTRLGPHVVARLRLRNLGLYGLRWNRRWLQFLPLEGLLLQGLLLRPLFDEPFLLRLGWLLDWFFFFDDRFRDLDRQHFLLGNPRPEPGQKGDRECVQQQRNQERNHHHAILMPGRLEREKLRVCRHHREALIKSRMRDRGALGRGQVGEDAV